MNKQHLLSGSILFGSYVAFFVYEKDAGWVEITVNHAGNVHASCPSE
jgi:hypothetical protein